MMDYKFPCRYRGITQGAYFRERRLGTEALIEVFDELGGWDIVRTGGFTTDGVEGVEICRRFVEELSQT
jgi:hypothetical protein